MGWTATNKPAGMSAAEFIKENCWGSKKSQLIASAQVGEYVYFALKTKPEPESYLTKVYEDTSPCRKSAAKAGPRSATPLRRCKMPRKMNLMGDTDPMEAEPHRPDLSVMLDEESRNHPITVCIRAMWGQQNRYIELSPLEARQFAKMLVDSAADAEALPVKQ